MGSIFANPRTKSAARKTYRSTSPRVAGIEFKHPIQHEERLQIKMSNYIKREYPQVILIGDFAAGLELTDKQRIKMMAMRSEDGQPDISIDYPSRGYHGLRIEIKKEGTVVYRKDGKLRKQPYKRVYWVRGRKFIHAGDHLAEQAATLKKYNDMGYLGRFGIGEQKIIQLIDWYMERPQNAEMF